MKKNLNAEGPYEGEKLQADERGGSGPEEMKGVLQLKTVLGQMQQRRKDSTGNLKVL